METIIYESVLYEVAPSSSHGETPEAFPFVSTTFLFVLISILPMQRDKNEKNPLFWRR